MEAINIHEVVAGDKVEFLMQLWKDKLKDVDQEKLRHNAESLVEDISNYAFDISSDSVKFEVLGNKFVEIITDDEIPACVDVYYIQDRIMRMFDMESREQEAFSMIFEINDETTRDASLLNEFLAGRHLMRNLKDVDKSLLERVFTEAQFKNVRNFMNGVIKHETFPVVLSEEINEIILHKCVEDGLIFLIDLMFEKLKVSDSKEIKRILSHTDGTGNNIFHLACENRLKFVIEDLWTLILKAFNDDAKEIADYLLAKNANEFNAFQLAFEMPLKYDSSDYANEIKSKENLFRFYRIRGPIELEMYNFESCLNFLYDFGRRNIPDRYKKSLIINKGFKRRNFYQNYVYSKEFSGFRHDFLQLRYYCITKLSSVKTDNFQKSSGVYEFLNHYVEKYMSKLNENELMELYTKLSYDSFMGDFFKVLVKNYFIKALNSITQFHNLKTLFEMTKKSLGETEFTNVLIVRGYNGNTALQWAINSSDFEVFQFTFDQIKNKKLVTKWITLKNTDGYNALYITIFNKNEEMLQVLLEYFDKNLTEEEIFEIFQQTSKGNYKFLEFCVTQYNRNIFNLLWSFMDVHLSTENQKLLVGENIISSAVSRWQESATTLVLDLIANLFDENEIKQILNSKTWELQTALHVASKNSNLSQIQMLCKFAHAFLSKEDFLELLAHIDSNEWNVINPKAPQEDIYNFLPNVSNFNSDRPVFEWFPLTNFTDIPKYAIEVEKKDNETFYVGKAYAEEDPLNFNLIKVSSSMMLEDGKCVDVLVGRGLKWTSSVDDNVEVKLERSDGNYLINKSQNSLNLITENSSEKCEVLVLDNKEVLITENPNWLFRRVY